MLGKFPESSIRKQIGALAIGLLILIAFLSALTEPFTLADIEGVSDTRRAAHKIEMVLGQLRASGTQDQRDAVLDAVSKSGLPAEFVPVSDMAGEDDLLENDDFRLMVQRKLPPDIKSAIRPGTAHGLLTNVLLVALDNDTALALVLPEPQREWVSDTQVDIIWKVLIVFTPVLTLFYYVGGMITAPLLRFAEYAEKFDPDSASDRPFEEQGSHEIRTLARSLNDMHSRIRVLIDQRTQMLRAISHDLRTPLTRLRLRAERSTQPGLRDAMIADIQTLTNMIEETLTYLSNEMSSEKPLKVDLPSLIGTACSDFADIGHSVAYRGPERFAYLCKPNALGRAIANLIDNGTKFAKHVEVELEAGAKEGVLIRVTDDGPGVPKEMRQSVLEPFFKADAARSDRKGFGLGLSIVHDIVRAHKGSISLGDARPHGLVVEIWLPAQGGAANADGYSGEEQHAHFAGTPSLEPDMGQRDR